MSRRSEVELFAEIRREHEFGVGTIQGVSRKLELHRRMVRQALSDAVPPARKSPERKKPRLEPVMGFINEVLEADRKAPRKQRHTSHRIYERIRMELPEHPIGESTVRRYVGGRKREMGLIRQETFVPQSYAWGQEAQIDWYEAVADLDGERQKVQVFCMRSMGSGGASLANQLCRKHPKRSPVLFGMPKNRSDANQAGPLPVVSNHTDPLIDACRPIRDQR